MATLTIRLPEDTTLRLKQLAASFWHGWTNATARQRSRRMCVDGPLGARGLRENI